MTLKAVLYDHDGTLVDSETVHYEIWTRVLRPIGAELSVEDYKRFHAGLPTLANAEDIKMRFGLSFTAKQLANMKEQATNEFLSDSKFPLMKGVLDSIAFFNSLELALAVVTGAGRRGVQTSIKAHGLYESFRHIISADDVQKSKPAPDGYLLAMQRLGITANECVAIEDTSHGAEAAKAAGIDCIVVPNSMSVAHSFPHAIKVCEDIMQASRWIAASYQLCR